MNEEPIQEPQPTEEVQPTQESQPTEEVQPVQEPHVPQFKVLDNGQVLTDEEPNVWLHHDREHHTILEAIKKTVMADGVDSTTIFAKIYNYLNELQTGFADPIKFEFEGTIIEVNPIGGVASIEFDAEYSGAFTVKTVNEKMRNGEVTFNV